MSIPQSHHHPIIPANTPDLPAVDSGRVPASELTPELLDVLVAAVAQNAELNEVPPVTTVPEGIVALTVHTTEDMQPGPGESEEYVCAEVEVTDVPGTPAIGNYTFTVE